MDSSNQFEVVGKTLGRWSLRRVFIGKPVPREMSADEAGMLAVWLFKMSGMDRQLFEKVLRDIETTP